MGAVLLHGLVPMGTPKRPFAPPHDLIGCAGFLAIVSPALPGLESAPPEALADLALHHNAVLVAYCTDLPVLPLRFGAAFSSAARVRQHLDPTAQQHLAALQTLHQVQEYTLRLQIINDPPTSTTPITSGRDFLSRGRALRDQRLNLTQRRQTLARSLLTDLQPISHQITAAGRPRPERLLDIAILLPSAQRDTLATLAETAATLAPALGLDLTVTGPWPAYSFDPATLDPEPCHGA